MTVNRKAIRRSTHFYDSVSGDYQAVAFRRQAYHESIDCYLASQISLGQDSLVLDIGTGDGVRYASLQKKLQCEFTKFHAVEESRCMAEEAKKRLPDTVIYNCKFEEIDFKERYDFIFALWNVIGHVERLDLFFNKIKCVLKDGGVFFLDCNSPTNIAEYGLPSVLRNVFSLFKYGKGVFRFKIGGGENQSVVKAYSAGYLGRVLENNLLEVERVVFFNYATGRKTNQFGGQRFLQIRLRESV